MFSRDKPETCILEPIECH